MTTGIIVFARMDSRRLPGKVLINLCGRPILGHVLDRARRVERADEVVVATSRRSIDDPIVEFVAQEGMKSYRGDALDVASRALACAIAHDYKRFVRITGDSPFFDPGLADRLIELAQKHDLDIATNVFPRSYPVGTSIEVIATHVMRRAIESSDDLQDREHITRYIYRNADEFSIHNVRAQSHRYKNLHLAVDNADDLRRCDWIVKQCDELPHLLPLEAIVTAAKAWPGESTTQR